MKTLYLECNMGASGDMLLGALIELLPDPEGFMEKINHLNIPGVSIEKEEKMVCGIHGTHMVVKIDGEEEKSHDVNFMESIGHTHHHGEEAGHGHFHNHAKEVAHNHEEAEHVHSHSHEEVATHSHVHSHNHGEAQTHSGIGMNEISHIISHMPISEKVKLDIRAVYQLIADAESIVHNKTIEQIHFHEVGTMDAIADVASVCLAIEELAPEKIIASPIHVGYGEVRCAHGILPVPAPATALLLRGIPCYGGKIRGELCTPTGAALLKHFVSKFGSQPVMIMEKIGYGMGTKEFAAANLLRAWWGECEG